MSGSSPYRNISRYAQDIQMMHAASEFEQRFGRIYISNIEAASNINSLKSRKIRAVITCRKGDHLPHTEIELPDYLYIPAEDAQHFDLARYFTKAIDFIQRNLKHTNVLIHCAAGISRSITLLIAYLMFKQKKPFVKVYAEVKKLRPIACPNDGFIAQLKDWETQLLRNRIIKPPFDLSARKKRLSEVQLSPNKTSRNPYSDSKPLMQKRLSTSPAFVSVRKHVQTQYSILDKSPDSKLSSKRYGLTRSGNQNLTRVPYQYPSPYRKASPSTTSQLKQSTSTYRVRSFSPVVISDFAQQKGILQRTKLLEQRIAELRQKSETFVTKKYPSKLMSEYNPTSLGIERRQQKLLKAVSPVRHSAYQLKYDLQKYSNWSQL